MSDRSGPGNRQPIKTTESIRSLSLKDIKVGLRIRSRTRNRFVFALACHQIHNANLSSFCSRVERLLEIFRTHFHKMLALGLTLGASFQLVSGFQEIRRALYFQAID